jgi:Bacterial Ig domain
VHGILRRYCIPLLMVPGVVLGVTLSAAVLAPSMSTAGSHMGARSAALLDYDQSIAAKNPNFSVVENGTLAEPSGTLLIGSSDSDPNATCCNVTADPSNPPSSGTVIFDANGDGGFSYSPNSGFSGTDSFGFILTDTDGNTAGGTVTVTVDPLAVTASDVSFTTATGSALPLPEGTLQTGDSDNNPESGVTCCSATLTAGPSNGTVSVSPSGAFTYTPASGFTGTDSFQYTLADSGGVESEPATVSVNVDPDVVATTTAMVEESPPAASPSTPITFVAQVTPKTSKSLSGTTVTFTWYRTGGSKGGGPATGTIGTAPVDTSNDEATFTTSNGDIEAGGNGGSLKITATFSGSSGTSSSAGAIIYYVLATCSQSQWPSVTNGIPNVTSTGTPLGYYIGQSNGWWVVYTSSAGTFTGTIRINGLLLYVSQTKDKTIDKFVLHGRGDMTYSIVDGAHLDGFTFYAGCGTRLKFTLKLNSSLASKKMIFLGGAETPATDNPITFTRTS